MGDLGGGKLFDVDFGRAALALLDALDQANALAGIQLGQQLDGLIMPAVQVGLYLVQRVVNINTAQLVIPAVSGGQAHAVQQQAVQQLGVRG